MSVTSKIVINQRIISSLAKLLANESQEGIGNKIEEAERAYHEDKWLFVVLAVDLCSNLEKVQKIKKSLKEKKMNGVQAFAWILMDWVNTNGNNATLENLLSIFVSNGLTTLAGTIGDAFIMCLAAREKAKLNQTPLDLSVNYTEEMKIYLTNAVFGNHLIQNILVSKLPVTAQKNMRLASAQWTRDNLSQWRKSVWVRINSNPIQYEYDGIPQPTVKPLNLQQFFNLFKQSDDGSWNDYISSMEENPFHRFNIIKETITKTNLSSGENFWKIFGPGMTHLKFQDCYIPNGQKFLQLMQWLLSTCPEVEEIRFIRWYQLEDETEEETELPVVKAEYLKTLDLSHFTPNINDEQSRKLFDMMPNLETLFLQSSKLLDPALSPFPDGSFLKIKTLHVGCSQVTDPHDFFRLKEYIEKFPEMIKELHVYHLDLEDVARVEPFHLYGAIEKCKSLENLRLDLIVSQDTLPWFMDLSPFTFENLKRFEVRIERELNFYGANVKFDLGTLRGMPKLEALSIQYFYKNMGRQSGAGDWLYQGERELFIPEGMKVKLSEETAPFGENLRDLEIYGWKLNSSDISLFQGWFPKLKSMTASFDKAAFQRALDWNGIQAITVDQHCKIYFRELYEAKEKHEGIRIFKDKGSEGIVEVVKEGDRVFLKA